MANRDVTPLPIDLGGSFDAVRGLLAGAQIRQLLGQQAPAGGGAVFSSRQRRREAEEAERTRQFQSEEAEKARQFQASEAEKGRQFQIKENEKERAEKEKQARLETELQVKLHKDIALFDFDLNESKTSKDAVAKVKAMVAKMEAAGIPSEEARRRVMDVVRAQAEGDVTQLELTKAQLKVLTESLKHEQEFHPLKLEELRGRIKAAKTEQEKQETFNEFFEGILASQFGQTEAQTKLTEEQAKQTEAQTKLLQKQLEQLGAALQPLDPQAAAALAGQYRQTLSSLISGHRAQQEGILAAIKTLQARLEDRPLFPEDKEKYQKRIQELQAEHDRVGQDLAAAIKRLRQLVKLHASTLGLSEDGDIPGVQPSDQGKAAVNRFLNE